MSQPTKQRIAYIDWMRGLACLLMFQTHCYDSWLSPAARQSHFFKLSQLVGTLPAPLFLFLAGISFALVTDRMRQRGASANEIANTTIRRGAEIFGLGLLFRVQEFALGYRWVPWTDLLRVDILNTMGFSMMLMSIACRFTQRRVTNGALAGAVAVGVAMFTPPLWTTWAPRWLPWFLETYVNGVHNLGKPQPWLFPIFPWAGFAFTGLAVGFVLMTDWARERQAQTMLVLGAVGALLFGAGVWFDARLPQIYRVYDFWHTSPNFFLARVGVLFGIVLLSYAWCRWGAGRLKFSPLITMGQVSLLVYWVHIVFVYGRFSILPKRGAGLAEASLGLLTIFTAMTLLAFVRTRTKGRGGEIMQWMRQRIRPVAQS
ncbi:MAG TPA: heparan-alpha-glucosaminide N-acetyltransferase domain-containing protein [Candidatus Acidoferrales bacterium]|nr:heparan-alpha-glucosaminide N-acetyltransferase domain-containing protein [Candidatus Acidoferrales bacterium]